MNMANKRTTNGKRYRNLSTLLTPIGTTPFPLEVLITAGAQGYLATMFGKLKVFLSFSTCFKQGETPSVFLVIVEFVN